MAANLPTATPTPRAPTAAGDTRTRVLDAAEALFIERGFAATSLRAIASRAQVNLGAANYHFGSKEGLLGAVVHRRVNDVVEARMGLLDRLEARGRQPDVNEILQVFFAPLVDSEIHSPMPRLIARLYGEPESIAKPLIEREFAETVNRFIAALQAALPGVDPDAVVWRFHFVIGSMIHLLAFEAPAGVTIERPPTAVVLGHLREFAVAGLRDGFAEPAGR